MNNKNDISTKKTLVLIDTDDELVKILKIVFESQNIEVKTYREGGDALKYLLGCTQEMLPSLIIAERKLPDMDGLEILSKLKKQFSEINPFFFVTVFTSDKDVKEGLKHGVTEYIGKPFNLSLLIEKALNSIFPK